MTTATAERKAMSTDSSSTNQALEKADSKTPAVITTPEQYRSAMQRWQEHYNVLTPFTNVSGIAPSFGIIASVVKIETDPVKGEVYSGYLETGAKGMPFLKGERGKPNEELAIAKIGLRKLAECGGISTSTQRTDPRTIPHYWEFKATASYRGLDGSTITREATFEWDLRDGSDRMKGWQANQVTEARKNGLRACEARAINAAVRECGCGIKQKYTREELSKPFVVVRVAFQPDFSDPDIKRMVTQQALSGVNAMYPNASRELPAGEHIIDQEPMSPAEPRHVGSSSTSQPPATTKSDADQPPTPDAVRIAKAEFKEGETRGRKWTKYTIVDSNGVQVSTFDKGHYDDAVRFKAENAWVEIVTERDGEHVNILEIVRAGQQPSLLPDPGTL